MVFKRFGFIVMLLLSMQSLLAQEIEASMGEYTFFENKGQWPNGVLYRAKMASGSIYLEQGRILYYFTDYSQLQATHANLQQNLTTD